jgi:hypothetical protein
MPQIRVYHGTDLSTSKRIVATGKLTGDLPRFGPGVCTTVSRALNFSAIKVFKHGANARKKVRILSFDIDTELLACASQESCGDAYTLNDKSNAPLRHLLLTNLTVLTVSQAQKLL